MRLYRDHAVALIEALGGGVGGFYFKIDMGRAAMAELRECGVEEMGAETPVAPGGGHNDVLDEIAGPALDEASRLALGSCDYDKGGVEFLVFDKGPPPLIEIGHGTAAAGIGGAKEGVQFRGFRLPEWRDGDACGKCRKRDRPVERSAEADVVSQGYSAATAWKPPCFSMKVMISSRLSRRRRSVKT